MATAMRSPRSAARGAFRLMLQAKARLEGLLKAINDAAAPKAKTYVEAIRAGKDNSWVDGFLAFRDEFEFADAAADAMAAFNELRAQHEQPAAKLMGEARGLFQQGRRDDGFAKAQGGCRQVLCMRPRTAWPRSGWPSGSDPAGRITYDR